MIIILKKIPANTSNHHIELFMGPVLKGGLFKASGRIESISFWTYEIVQSDTVEHYALVDVEPDAVGQRVIDQLNKKQINGKHITIQKYHIRHWSNDKRELKAVADDRENNKRKTDRRRKIIKTEKSANVEHITISSHSSSWNDPNNQHRKS